MYLKEYSLNSNQTCMRCNAFKVFTLVIIHVDHDVTERQNGVTYFNCPPRWVRHLRLQIFKVYMTQKIISAYLKGRANDIVHIHM